MTLHGPQHFPVIAVVGREEVGTDKQKNDVIIFDMVADLGMQFLTCFNAPIMLGFNNALPFQHC
jgi:hypothetical protein